jgi:DNA uptake protein ComE-like DNA-binding protein
MMTGSMATAERDPARDVIPSVGFAVAVCMCVAAGLAFAVHMTKASADHRPFAIEDRINPNDASPASLGRLPGIGPARARAIVDYRRRWLEQDSDGLAFGRPQDLEEIAGIGPATATTVSPWLSFDAPPADEQPDAGEKR